MHSQKITPQFEANIKHAFGVPEMRSEFKQQMHLLISEKAEKIKTSEPKHRKWKKTSVYAISLIGILLLIILAAGPENVLASVQKLFGYVPGMGLVEQGTTIRVLAEKVVETRDGIKLTISDGYFNDEKTVIIYSVDNVPYSVYPKDENVVGCSEFPFILLPDGTRLPLSSSWGNGHESNILFSPVPDNLDEITFVVPCILNSLPGSAPEDWRVQLSIIPAPADMVTIPVLEVGDTTPTSSKPTAEVVETFTSGNKLNIQVFLDQAIPLEDGYYLIGHNEWQDARITAAWPSGFALKAVDAKGISLPIEPASLHDIGISEISENQWLYRLYGRGFTSPLTITMEMMSIEFQSPVSFEVNPESFGFDPAFAEPSTSYTMDPIELDLLGYEARIIQADYMVQGMMSGFDFSINADPNIFSIPFSLTSQVVGGNGARGGGSSYLESKELVSSILLSDGKMEYPLQFQVNSISIKGNWSTVWNAPVEIDRTPVVFNECFSLDDWKNLQENPPMLPAELSGKILFSRAAMAPNPSEFIANLDGNQEQSLVFGQGSLSPDGSQLVYSNQEGQIVLFNLNLQTETLLFDEPNAFRPIWSPDGKSIAFTSFNEVTQIQVMDADGSNLRVIKESNRYPTLLGWAADSKQLLYREQHGERRQPLIVLDINSETEQEQFNILNSAAMSPDGQWIAFIDSVPGKMGSGLFVSKMDQSEKRLLVQLDYLPISNVIWSPDGKWLGFSFIDTSTFTPTYGVGLINFETCQGIPLNIPGIEILKDWQNP